MTDATTVTTGRRIAVVGNRDFRDRNVVTRVLDRLVQPGDVLVSGGARGPDTWAEEYARAHGLAMKVFPALWKDLSHPDADIRKRLDGSKYDARAGYRRNQFVVDAAEVVLAFVADDRNGGTEDTIMRAVGAGKRVRTWYASGRETHPLVVHKNRARYDVCVGRPSKYGNDYSHRAGTLARFVVPSVEEAVSCFKRDFLANAQLVMDAKRELCRKRLACYCAPGPCHAEVIAEAANSWLPFEPMHVAPYARIMAVVA